MQCPRCQQHNPSHAKFCLECGTPFHRRDESTQPAPSNADPQRSLTEALEQQTATAEILRVISQSPTDVQPVMQTIVDSAVRLADAENAMIGRAEGDHIRWLAVAGTLSPMLPHISGQPISRSLPSGRAILDRQTTQVDDISVYGDEFPGVAAAYRELGVRTILATPLLREGNSIGVILVRRTAVRPFTDQQIALLQTFADQAVIALENVRLFTELQEKNRALTQAHAQVTETLEQQTATSDVLRVISRSPTDVQPVFDTIIRNAVQLCGARLGSFFHFDGERLHLVANHGHSLESLAVVRRAYPMRPDRTQAAGRSILDRALTEIPDARGDPAYDHGMALAMDWRSVLAVPLLRGDGSPIGVIVIQRQEGGHFAPGHVELLKTFADQAVIAIENVRLFKELEARNHALTESLDQQTATSEILRVISSSPTDTQPVFDAIAESAARLCRANDAQVLRVDGDVLRLVAECGATSMPSVRQLTRGHLVGRAVIDRQTIHVQDLAQALAEYPESTAARYGIQSALAVPLLHEGVALGVIRISRTEIRPFTDKQIALLQTFADQAVIAIENVRLFKELETRNADLTDALSRQTATSEILRVISGSPTDVQPVFDTIIKSAVTLCNGVFGSLDRFDGDLIYPVATHNYTPEALDAVQRIFPARPSRSLGVGRAILDCDVVHIADVELDPEYRVQNLAGTIGFRSGLFVPMLRDGVPIGVILVARAEPGPFSDNQIALLKTFADQAVIAIENVRLFKELEAANRELAAASHHKSEFLANMSHELRTPLNAIIGFSEVLTDRMFGELNEKQEEYLKDINASGIHLLSLINDILDLSKIEAGRMELELTDFDLPTALDNALMLVRERAQRRSLMLHKDVDAGVGQIQGDERKIRQVVLNLLSNAIKFTPEGGRIDLAAVTKGEFVEVSVSDTGVGIAPEDQEKVFEEFRQVGTADKKAEGTGLGLTLCRKFIELHGGRISLKSQVDVGSRFTFTIPVRRVE